MVVICINIVLIWINILYIYKFDDFVLWALYVGWNRNKIDINGYKKLERLLNKINSYDIVIGLIADDKIGESFRHFIEGDITDNALVALLREVNYGMQYTIKNQNIIRNKDLVEINSRVLSRNERADSVTWGRDIKQNLGKRLSTIRLKYRRSGKFIDEVLEEYK